MAAAAGVSAAVVSRVLNPNSGPVAPTSRDKVNQAVAELGYRPRPAVPELSQSNATRLALMIADLINPVLARLADRIVWEAHSRGVQVVLITTQEDPYLEADALDALLSGDIGGVIACPTGGNVEKWAKLVEVGVKVVFVDRVIPTLANIDVVTVEDSGAAQLAAEHLIRLGHTRIGLLSGPLEISAAQSQLKGYENAHANASIPVDVRLIREVSLRGSGGGGAVGSLLTMPIRPTALMVTNTAQGQNAVRRFVHARIRVPQDLSVIIFDDSSWTEVTEPPLDVIHQPTDTIAAHCCDLVVGRIQAGLPRVARRITVPAGFLSRGSCGPPRAQAEAPRPVSK